MIKFEATELPIAQVLVDKMMTHAATMKRQCNVDGDDNGACAYRGPNEERCVVGALIADDRYTDNMENSEVCYKHLIGIPELDGIEKYNFEVLLTHFQSIHDDVYWNEDDGGFNYSAWMQFKDLIEEHHLQIPPVVTAKIKELAAA